MNDTRHPINNCKNWSREEGCIRNQGCKYLHRHSNQFEKNLNQTAETENFSNDVNDIVSISTCEFCRIEFDSQDLMSDHIDAMHVEEVLH